MDVLEILKEHKLWLCTDGGSGERADFKNEKLKNSNFIYTDLERANFKSANLRNTDFKSANLRNTDFQLANLQNVNFENTDLRFANFKNSNLNGVFLEGAWLEGVNVEGAKGILQWQSPQEDRNICYSVKHDNCIMHQLGDFWGDTKSAIVSIRKKYGDDSLYERFLLLQVEALENE